MECRTGGPEGPTGGCSEHAGTLHGARTGTRPDTTHPSSIKETGSRDKLSFSVNAGLQEVILIFGRSAFFQKKF